LKRSVSSFAGSPRSLEAEDRAIDRCLIVAKAR